MKKTFVANSRIEGLENPKVDKQTGAQIPHVVEVGEKYEADEDHPEIKRLVAAGALLPKGEAPKDDQLALRKPGTDGKVVDLDK